MMMEGRGGSESGELDTENHQNALMSSDLDLEESSSTGDVVLDIIGTTAGVNQTGSFRLPTRETPIAPTNLQDNDSVISNTPFCRICHDPNSGALISPCHCKGSLSMVHKECLERWLAESDTSVCDLCRFNFVIERQPKYSLPMSLFAWLISSATWRERRSLIVDLISLLIITPVIFLSSALAVRLIDTIFIEDMEKSMKENIPSVRSIIVGNRGTVEGLTLTLARIGQMSVISLVITMDMAYISWLALRIQHHLGKWYRWYRRNVKVTLKGFSTVEIIRQPSQPIASD